MLLKIWLIVFNPAHSKEGWEKRYWWFEHCNRNKKELTTSLAELRICWLYSLHRQDSSFPKKGGLLGITLNCIWWWDSSSRTSGSVEYPFMPLLPGPLWPRVVVLVKVLSTGQIDLFANYSYKIVISDII